MRSKQRTYCKETIPDTFEFKVSKKYLDGTDESKTFTALRVSEDSFMVMWLNDKKQKQLVHYHINHIIDYLLNYDWIIVD